MSNVASGIDVTAWHFPTITELNQLWDMGCRVVSGYISYDASKDLTAALVKTLHNYRRSTAATYGFGVLFNFESTANRALSGPAAGLADGTYARNRIHSLYSQCGYVPHNKLSVPFSVDFDTNPAQYPTIDGYLRSAQSGLTAEFAAGAYGEYDLIVHTARAGTSHFEWQTYAWSQGKFAAGIADYYQWRNSVTLNQGRGIVDLDQMISDGHSPFGAWWGPTHPLNHPASTQPPVKPPTAAPTDFVYPHGDAGRALFDAVELLRSAVLPGYIPGEVALTKHFANLIGLGIAGRLAAVEKAVAAQAKPAAGTTAPRTRKGNG
jgi:hypothetical protein